MREIKFRAWDKESCIWLDDDYFIICPYNGVVIEIDYVDGRVVLDEINNDVILEQYTGLKDFNGAEIYKGDILQDVDDSTIVGVVEYDEAFGEYDCGANNLYECTRDCVVIGNVHQNANLLNDNDRISPDDIGNDIHELHGGDK